MKTKVSELREIGKNCAEVEFYESTNTSSPHTDNVKFLDVVFDELKEEIECDYFVMDEEEYNHTIMANCGETDSFEDWLGDKNAKVLIVVINADSEYLK